MEKIPHSPHGRRGFAPVHMYAAADGVIIAWTPATDIWRDMALSFGYGNLFPREIFDDLFEQRGAVICSSEDEFREREEVS